MPRSRRAKVVNLTKVKKKASGDRKDKLQDEVRSQVESKKYAYVVSLENQRSTYLKVLRKMLAPGRLFYGKNRVMQHALGIRPETESQPNVHGIAKRLRGERGLLFSDLPLAEVQALFSKYQPADFARSGTPATKTVTLEAGGDSLKKFPHSMETQLRRLGLPTILKDGVIMLLGNFTVCTAGVPLTPEQAQLVRLLGIPMAKFTATVNASWERETGEVVEIEDEDDEADNDDEAAESESGDEQM
eukprot:GDKH01001151.1.p1 GENE.GDKH01001151.1~~GDKH01001151.1.p1  ORF type:complete len:245 (-),score=59.97 GDKH01001151.1:107-841(-)